MSNPHPCASLAQKDISVFSLDISVFSLDGRPREGLLFTPKSLNKGLFRPNSLNNPPPPPRREEQASDQSQTLSLSDHH
jgi:hypothetical protein